MARVRDDGYQLRRRTRVLLASDAGNEAEKTLRLGEWDKFKASVKEMHAANPIVDAAIPCADQSDHFNLEGVLSCIECNPFHCDLGFDYVDRNESKSDS